jgi:hypothetical protein
MTVSPQFAEMDGIKIQHSVYHARQAPFALAASSTVAVQTAVLERQEVPRRFLNASKQQDQT